jgi:hypothetical protein
MRHVPQVSQWRMTMTTQLLVIIALTLVIMWIW